jgi:excisionase family DNA binding protein
MNNEKTYSPKEVAQRLSCHLYFVRAEIRDRKMAPVLRPNARVIRVPESTLSAYIKARTT